MSASGSVQPPLFAAFRLVVIVYAVTLLLLLTILEEWAEKVPGLSLLLFVPPQSFALPLLILLPAALLYRAWRWCALLAACGIFVFGVYMTCRWHPRSKGGDGVITIVTHNVGEDSRPQFYGFLDAEDPDIIIMQDVRNRAGDFARRYPKRYINAQAEFICVSKFPITDGRLLDPLGASANGKRKPRERALAARFEVQIGGRPVALYSIHFLTPRAYFMEILHGRLRTGLVDFQAWTSAKEQSARAVTALIAEERIPTVIAGDLNTPDHGSIYHLFSRVAVDAFAKAGSGWGLTFPGSTHNPVAFFGPWLRLDYLFSTRGLEPISCYPEPGRLSQHCAVVGRFRLPGLDRERVK